LNPRDWLDALKSGRTLATNGPLLGLQLGGAEVGDELKYRQPQKRVDFTVRMDSIVAVDHLDLVCNGRVVQSFTKRGALEHARFQGHIPIDASGWCVARASSDGGRYPVLDNYVYATTSPIYVTLAGAAPRSAPDAQFFEAWIDRTTASTTAYPDWNDAVEKAHVLDTLKQARAVFATLEHGTPAP
jgi:TolB protein